MTTGTDKSEHVLVVLAKLHTFGSGMVGAAILLQSKQPASTHGPCMEHWQCTGQLCRGYPFPSEFCQGEAALSPAPSPTVVSRQGGIEWVMKTHVCSCPDSSQLTSFLPPLHFAVCHEFVLFCSRELDVFMGSFYYR